MPSRNNALKQSQSYATDGRFLSDLSALVAIASESQTPENRGELRRYLTDGIIPHLVALGFETEIHDNPDPAGGPILVASRVESPDLPTVLSYGHGDVIKGQKDLWRAGLHPYELVQDGAHIYGRGTADNKSQHLINIAALGQVIATRGALGFNAKLVIEMSEETGSPGLWAFCETHRTALASDVLIASDGPRLSPDVPCLFMGARGAINFNLSVTLRDEARHSGNWGGLLADPAMILSQALATITDARGQIQVPEWRPTSLTADIAAVLADLPVVAEDDWGEANLSAAQRVYGWNSFAILALISGLPEAPQNAIAGAARATCQLRYVVGTDPDDILPALRRHLDAAGFHIVKITPSEANQSRATRLNPDHPWVQFVAASFLATTGTAPHILPNFGGFIPNEIFSKVLGLPTIWVPHSYNGCCQHAPNEHILAPLAAEALQLMTGLFWDIGDPDTAIPNKRHGV